MPKIHVPVIAYKQGDRQMMTTAMSSVELVRMVSKPEAWEQSAEKHGNRPRDNAHLKGIVHYLETVQHFVLGAAVLYLTSKEATITRAEIPMVSGDNDVAYAGVLSVDIGAKFDIGDGQHRIGAYENIIIQGGRDDDDPLMQRLSTSGQPLIIVIEDDHKRRAQDFADLQRNVKMPSTSLGQSMDRRSPLNQALNELFEEVPIFQNKRVEFLKDNPGIKSNCLFSFKTIRYVSGLLLVGNKYRSPATMEKAVDERFETEEKALEASAELRDFWSTLGELVRFADVVDGSTGVTELRQATYLTSAGVLYAIAYAVYMMHSALNVPITRAVGALDSVSFDRTDKTHGITEVDTVFAGNLIDKDTGKLASGRTAWESAAATLGRVIANAGGTSQADEEGSAA